MILCDSGVRPAAAQKEPGERSGDPGWGVYFRASRRQLTPVNFPKIKKAIRSEFD